MSLLKLEKEIKKMDEDLSKKFETIINGFNQKTLVQNENDNLRADVREIKTHINWIIALIPVSVAILGVVLGMIMASNNANVNSLRNELKTEIQSNKVETNKNLEMINQKLDAMQKYNQIYIENEVKKQILKEKK